MPFVHKPDVAPGMRKCTSCGEIRPLYQYYRNKRSYLGRLAECKYCMNERKKQWIADNPELARLHRHISYAREMADAEKREKKRLRNAEVHRKRKSKLTKMQLRERHLRTQYHITEEQFQEMARMQNGRCAICDRIPDKLHVDHDHDTGKVRRLLCRSCNVALGFLGDNIERMRKAIEYLEQHNAPTQ